MAAERRAMRIMISTGHLGTAPSGPASFRAAIDTMPDYLVADGGSSDPGPVYLGDNSVLGQFVEDELELFLVESRRRGIPLIIGSAGDSGSNHGVDETVRQLRAIAERPRSPRFRIGWFHSEVPGESIARRIAAGERMPGLGGFPDLTAEEALNATRIVAVAGVDPFIRLLEAGCDVIVGGRCGDVCFTAAPCIRAGYPPALAYHMGKMIECASLVAEPFMGKEAIIGTITDEDIRITPFHPGQRVTVASAAGHSMYERETPHFEHMLGGVLDMRDCRYEAVDGRSTRITGARFIPDDPLTVKLEGARKIGERCMGIAAIRDPHVIRQLDAAIEWSRSASARTFAGVAHELHYHVFGRDGVLKELEPRRDVVPHEVCIVVEGVAATEAAALKLVDFATRMFFLARIPDSKGSSGLAACTKQTMRSSPAFVWNVNHTMTVDDPLALFPTGVAEAGV
ncbi:DUF1446 domain-containing protein [Leptolyngbya sp. 15MV]|nr:DUF1446 domain-containing protein [Leptolyngbya sp. 15MV]